MRKKSKWLAVLLCCSIFAAMAIGSGSSSGEKKDVVSSDEKDGTTDSDDGTSDDTSKESVDVSIEEQVVVDIDGLKVTATEYADDSIWGEGIKLLVENNTDKTYTVGCDALIVNDYMISDLFVAEVAAGKKSNETMYLSSSELEAAGIDAVGKIEIYLHAYESDDWTSYLFKDEYCEIQTSAYANMDTTVNDEGNELYNEGGIRIVGKTVDENSFWGTAILLYVENTSGANVGISVEEMSINGFMIDPIFSTTVYDGKKAFDDVTVFSSDLEENGIEKIEEVELKFHIYDADSYSTICDSDPITFTAE